MKLAFTICSNNYLSLAKALGDSLTKYNPEFTFKIALVDFKAPDVDYTIFEPYEIIPIADAGISPLEEMCSKYNITELNTAVKPYLFDFLFRTNPQADRVIYFDPDILVYRKLDSIETAFLDNDIILTPHFFTPIYDDFLLDEPSILNAGLYNLGFIALKRGDNTDKLLSWWKIKLKDQCLIDFAKGLFVDQLWINFVPLYFEKVFILRDLGYNVAYWNLHEREISESDGEYLINGKFKLAFYHFSGFDFRKPSLISKYQTRYSFEQRTDVLPLFEAYHKIVTENNFEHLSTIPCRYIPDANDGDTEIPQSSNVIKPRPINSIRSLVRRVVSK